MTVQGPSSADLHRLVTSGIYHSKYHVLVPPVIMDLSHWKEGEKTTCIPPTPKLPKDLIHDLKQAGEIRVIRPAGGPLIPIAAVYSQPFGSERNIALASAHEREPVCLFDVAGEQKAFTSDPVIRGVSAMFSTRQSIFAADAYAGTIMSMRRDCTHLNWRYEQRYSSPDLNARPIIETMTYGANHVFAFHAGLGAVQIFNEETGVLEDIIGPKVAVPPSGQLKSLRISEHRHKLAYLANHLVLSAFVDVEDEGFHRTDIKVISNTTEVMTTSQLLSRAGAVGGMVADNRVGELMLAVGNDILVFGVAAFRGHFTVPGCERYGCQIYGLNLDEQSGDLLVTYGDLTMAGMSGVTTISAKARHLIMTPHDDESGAEPIAVGT